jgi:hypothetical protein
MAWTRLRGHLLISCFNFIFVLAKPSTVTHENVIFQKSNEITITRSQWLVSFVIDLGSYTLFIERLTNERVNAAALSRHLLLEYKKQGKPLFQTFKNLRASNLPLKLFRIESLMPSLRLAIKTFYGGFLKSLILESHFLELFLL